jgi:hypothetical protein
MDTKLVVEALRYEGDRLDLSDFHTALEFALDQRCFGPRRVLVVTCDGSGSLLGLAHCERSDPPEMAVLCCLDTLDDGARAAVAYSDEMVREGPATPELEERFLAARAVALGLGVHLVDWIICDDQMMRSIKLGLDSDEEDDGEMDWWDVPTSRP